MTAVNVLITLNSTQASFLPRILQISNGELLFPCSECIGSKIKCNHLEKCSECTIYQIEKLLRCENCCTNLLGSYPNPCSGDCNRNNITQNVSAKCDACSGPLRKKCKGCKKSPEFVAAKTNLKKFVRIFITCIHSVKGSSIRPCSHCRLCIKCKQTLTKGHRERAVCSNCKAANNSSATSQSQSPSPTPTKLISQEAQKPPNPCSLSYILNDRPQPDSAPCRLPPLKRKLPALDSIMEMNSNSNPPKRQMVNYPQQSGSILLSTPQSAFTNRMNLQN